MKKKTVGVYELVGGHKEKGTIRNCGRHLAGVVVVILALIIFFSRASLSHTLDVRI